MRSAHDEPVTTEADTLGPAARTGDAERSWLSRLRSSKASGEKQHLVRSAHDDLVTTEAFRNLEKHLASLAALRDVCASIDQRLARVEQVSGQRDGATIDEALHDLCSQIYDRLVRVEAAAQRTEGFVPEKPWDLSTIADQRLERVEETLRLTHQSLADSPVPGMCANIERELVQARTALQRTEEAVADKTLYELCKNIDARLERTEDTLHRNEGTVAEWLQQLSARMTARFAEAEETIQRLERERVEETLRLTQQSLADSMLPDTCANIERHLVQARMALQRTEEAVADKTLQELCKNIDARLARTEDTLHRSEGSVTEWLQELSADMTARFAEAEEAIQRIERIVSSRTVEQIPSQQLSVRTDSRPVQAEETARPLERPLAGVPADIDLREPAHATSESREPADGGVLTRAVLVLSRFVNIKQTNRPVQLPWAAGLALPVMVVVAALALGSLIRTSLGVAPEKVVPLTTTNQTSTPVVPAANQRIRAPSTAAVMANAPRSTGESRIVAPPLRSPDREPAPTTTRAPRFVGTLSVTSVPSGASVSINGKPAGVTPLKLPRQRAGSLAVQIAHDGFERWSAAVVVPADGIAEVTARLRATAR
ncbi:MAG TPA: PEGA domain-containing protein [Vicinamibacterales bacterium]|nr:PEGA domain-containing protein [Vicinamibacterales bacterium]